MQQDRATLIYDLYTMKGTVESYLKRRAQPFKTEQFQAWKFGLGSVLSHLKWYFDEISLPFFLQIWKACLFDRSFELSDF